MKQFKDLSEVKELRHTHSKTFALGDGKRKLVCSQEPIHYEKNGELVDIDLTPQKTETGFFIDGPGWTADVEGAKFTFRADGKEFIAESLDNPDISKINLKDGGIEIAEAFPGVDLFLHIRPKGLEWYKRIKNPEAKHDFQWKVSKDQGFVHRAVPVGKDDKGNKAILSHVREEKEDHVILNETFERKVAKVVDSKTRKLNYSDEVIYPVYIDVPDVSVPINSGFDIAREYVHSGGAPFSVHYYGAQIGNAQSFFYYDSGLRFGGINVPQGATIDDAKIVVYQRRSVGTGAKAKWFGVAVDNLAAAPWVNVHLKPRTTANKPFVTTAMTYPYASKQHLVTSPIQEIVNRAGWASGNGLGLVAVPSVITGSGQSFITGYPANPPNAAPVLEINYTAGGGGGGFQVAWARNRNTVIGSGGTV